MAKLIKQAQGRLNKAGDAARDPADIAASDTDDTTDITSDGSSADISASNIAGVPDSATADVSASPPASTSAHGKAGRTDDPSSSTNGSKKAGTNAGKTASSKKGKGRRVGRPAGPARTPLTVRVLAEIDDALTDAVDDTGLSPQYIADEALSEWLRQRGYLTTTQQR